MSEYERVLWTMDDLASMASNVSVYFDDEDGEIASAVRAWATERGREVTERVRASEDGGVYASIKVKVRGESSVTVLGPRRKLEVA